MTEGSSQPEPLTDLLGNDGFTYTGRELEAMSAASNYHSWILGIFTPYLGRHLVEVGAGMGSFSELILSHHVCETLSLVEPSREMFEHLRVRARQLPASPRIDVYHASFPEAAPQITAKQAPDSVIYVNVLEHIEDDEAELAAILDALSRPGRVFIFVPALTWLYGAFDERVGHLRRYMKSELEGKLSRAGFQILVSTYFDLAGVAPWWIKYRLLKSATMQTGAVRFYDRYIVPSARRFESVIKPPIGKNLIVVAEKR